MSISYRKFEPRDSTVLEQMAIDFYEEDTTMEKMSVEKVKMTIDSLTNNPDRWDILMIEADGEVVWYSILINFWSNEFGGNVLSIDEIYIIPSFRRNSIGTNFIQYIIDSKFNNWVCINLLVSPHNESATKLYERIWFRKYRYDQLTFDGLTNT